MRRGASSAAASLLLLVIAGAPSRVAGVLRVPGSFISLVLWAVAGLLRDLAAIFLALAPMLLVLAFVLPRISARLRTPRAQRAGLVVITIPFALALWLFGVTAQEFKHERGSYPTIFDLAEGASSSTFLQGMLGFVRYDAFRIPALIFGSLAAALLAIVLFRKSRDGLVAWGPHRLGALVTFALAAFALRLFVFATSAPQSAYGASVVGDPFRAITESTVDLLVHHGRSAPRELVLDIELPEARVDEGARLLGWPPHHVARAGEPCVPHPFARPLDRASEPSIHDPRGEELVRAFERISPLVYPADDANVIVWQLALESFRADDIHALNAEAPREIDPFVNGLYEAADRGEEGVLASRGMYQAGVRTAQGLGALTCGLGTLPYNLSIIRDLQPFAMRCVADVLHDAGFKQTFVYGSDATFDGMSDFFRAHGYDDLVSQAELPADLPTGAWSAVTDIALFEEATSRIAKSFESAPSPRFVTMMSLSNHSPYTAPGDLPPDVALRIDKALATAVNHAIRDDRARVITHAYTDAAIGRFFARLDALHLAERSIVVLSADHSTGETYVWGPDLHAPETDDAKAEVPFVVVFPKALLERAHDRAALNGALRDAQRAIDAGPLSQNDIPALILALLRSHEALRALPAAARWHTLGGEVTSPWFAPIPRPGAYIDGINSVSELYALDRKATRVAAYEESIFLKTRGDRYVITPSLVPVAATLSAVLHAPANPCFSVTP